MTDLSDPRVPGGGAGKKVTLGGTTTIISEAAGLVVDGSRYNIPLAGIVPTISTVAAGTLKADAADGKLACLRVTINPGDAIAAATRLANGTVDTKTIFIDDQVTFEIEADGTDGEITDVYILAIGDGTGTDNNVDNIIDSSEVLNVNGQLATTVGTVAMPDATAAELIAATNMIHLEFSSTDKVRDALVRFGNLLATDTEAYITVEGRSYA